MNPDLATLPNLGPRSVAMLNAAAIHSASDLRTLGALEAFIRVRRSGAKASLNLLWALVGALEDQPWQLIARTRRMELLLALEDRGIKA